MDADECTEDQCILMIKEILQIENAFKMDLMSEDGDTHISITWNDLNQKRVEEEYCEGCKTKELRNMIGGLVEKLVGVKDVVKEEPPKKVEPVVVAKKVTIPKVEPKVVVEKKVEEPIVVVEKKGKGVLYLRYDEFGIFGWYKSGNEKKHIKYSGGIQNGKPNGQGKSTFVSGSKYVGEYKDGKPWNITETDKNGKITGKFVNGEWIKQ